MGIALEWKSNSFMFDVDLQDATTMCEVLTELSRIHDPLRLFCPLIIPGRIIMQEVWLSKVDWDDSLPGCLGDVEPQPSMALIRNARS